MIGQRKNITSKDRQSRKPKKDLQKVFASKKRILKGIEKVLNELDEFLSSHAGNLITGKKSTLKNYGQLEENYSRWYNKAVGINMALPSHAKIDILEIDRRYDVLAKIVEEKNRSHIEKETSEILAHSPRENLRENGIADTRGSRRILILDYPVNRNSKGRTYLND